MATRYIIKIVKKAESNRSIGPDYRNEEDKTDREIFNQEIEGLDIKDLIKTINNIHGE